MSGAELIVMKYIGIALLIAVCAALVWYGLCWIGNQFDVDFDGDCRTRYLGDDGDSE